MINSFKVFRLIIKIHDRKRILREAIRYEHRRYYYGIDYIIANDFILNDIYIELDNLVKHEN